MSSSHVESLQMAEQRHNAVKPADVASFSLRYLRNSVRRAVLVTPLRSAGPPSR